MDSVIFGNGKYELYYEPDNPDGSYILGRLDIGDGCDECLGMWFSAEEMLFDIDHGEISDEITPEDWQKICDWAL